MRRQLFCKRRRIRRWVRYVVIWALILSFLVLLVAKCRPSMTAFAESRAVWVATKTANETVARTLLRYAGICRQMIQVNYTETGQLSSIIPDNAAVNTVRTAITDAAMAKMDELDSLSVSIPMGTLFGPNWLSGWGPTLSFPISFTSTVLSDVSSTLEAVGINQSAYRLMIHLDITLSVITPGGRSSVGAQLTYPMAEAVLLGEVPDNLTEVYGDDQSLLGRIFDYGTSE